MFGCLQARKSADCSIDLSAGSSFSEAMGACRRLLQSFSARLHSSHVIQEIFGQTFPPDQAKDLLSAWSKGEVDFPSIHRVSRSALWGGDGCYLVNRDIILVSDDQSGNELVRTLLEEYGHAIDARYGVSEAPGDEGAIFAALVFDDELTSEDLERLRSENDIGFVIFEGRAELAEFREFSRDDIGKIQSGFQQSIGKVEGGAAQKIYNQPLPLFGSDLMTSYNSGVSALVTIGQHKQTIYDFFAFVTGQTGSGRNGSYTDSDLANYLNSYFQGTGTRPINYDATTGEWTVAVSGTATPFTQVLSQSQGLGLNGLLTMSANGSAHLDVSYSVNLTAGFDGDFYLNTTKAGTSPELSIGLSVATAPDPLNPTLSVGGTVALGGLQLFQATVLPTTNVNASFGVDLVDNGDGKLRVSELANDYSFIRTAATGGLNLAVSLDTLDDAKGLLDLHTELGVAWDFKADASGFFGSTPTITLANTKLNFLSFLNDTIKPFLESVAIVLEPVKAVMEVLKADIGFLHQIPGANLEFLDVVDSNDFFEIKPRLPGSEGADGVISLLDLLALKDPIAFETVRGFLVGVDKIVGLYNFLSAPLTFAERLSLGNFALSSDIRDGTFDFDTLNGAVRTGAQDLGAFLTSSNITGADLRSLQSMFGLATGGNLPTALQTNVAAPLISNAQASLGYLFGQNYDLLKIDLPKLAINIGGELNEQGQLVGPLIDLFHLPVFGLDLKVEGALRAIADIDFGYDTRGLQHYVLSGTVGGTLDVSKLDPNKLLDGLYVTDWGPDGKDRVELSLGAQLNFVLGGGIRNLVEARAGGAIEGIIDLDIVDVGNPDDGKVHWDEFASSITEPLKFFEGHGLVTAGLIAYARFFGYTKEFRSPTITLGEFNFGGQTGDPFDPKLAELDTADDYVVNIGPNAQYRAIADKLDAAEEISITPTTAGDRFTVSGFGYTQTFDVIAGSTVHIQGGTGDDIVNVGRTFSMALNIAGDQGADILSGGAGDDTIYGDDSASIFSGNDYLVGEDGNDSLFGGRGDDVLEGGAGADSLSGGAGIDLATYIRSTAAISIDLTRATQTGGDAQGDTLTSIELIVGSDIDGQGDTIADVDGSIVDNVFSGLKGNDTLIGGGGNDTLLGGEGNDVLDGGAGVDLLAGGLGDDIYGVDSLSDVVDEDFDGPAGGTDIVISFIDYSLEALGDIEQLRLVGAARKGTGNGLDNWIKGTGFDETDPGNFDDKLFGLAGNDTLKGGRGEDILDGGTGNDRLEGGDDNDTLLGGADRDELLGETGSDTLDGGTGADTLRGGSGDDVLIVDNTGDVVDELNGEGFDRVSASVDYVLTAGAHIEVLSAIDAAATTPLSLRGNAFAQLVVGNVGDNVLEGMEGADTLVGGAGYDVASYEHASAAVTLNFRTGLRTGDAEGDTFDGIEEFRGSDLDTGGLADVMIGTDAADILNGLGGADVLMGYGGRDVLFGGSGNDLVDGGAGDDTMAGGAGDDTYLVDSYGDVIDDDRSAYGSGSGGRDTIVTSLNYSLAGAPERAGDIEDLRHADPNNTIAWIGTGNGLANRITGAKGNDTLDGGLGADTLVGGAGNDLYYLDNVGDRVVENVGEGTDEIRVAGAGWALQGDYYTPYPVNTIDMRVDWLSQVENATLDGAYPIHLIGNELDNRLVGNGWYGTNLTGGGGSDTLVVSNGRNVVRGDDGFDTLVVNWLGSDRFYEGRASGGVTAGSLTSGYSGAFDSFYGDSARVDFSGIERFELNLRNDRDDDVLTGDGNDIVRGNGGNDTLKTAGGVDKVFGGLGDDRWEADKSFMSSAQDMVLDLRAVGQQGSYLGSGEVWGIESLNLKTGAGNDVVLTLDGFRNDVISTGAGEDRVRVAGGRDTVDLGEGSDTLVLDWSTDAAFYSSGASEGITSGSLSTGYNGNFNTFYSDAARVDFRGVERFDLNFRSDRDDNVQTGDGDDVIRGNGGNDYLRSGGGNDSVFGGDGNDWLDTGTGIDVVDGGSNASLGADRWQANQSVQSEAMIIDLNLSGIQGTYAASGSVRGIEAVSITTGGSNDVVRTLGTVQGLTTFGFDDVVNTGLGADTVEVFGGRDIVDLGSGDASVDTLLVDWSQVAYGAYYSHPWIATFSGSSASGYVGTFATGDPRDHHRVDFAGVERFVVRLGAAADSIRTGDGNDVLSGGAGNDYLSAFGGNDTLIGGAGADTLEGGLGQDTLSYETSLLGVNIDLSLTGSQAAGGDGAGDVVSGFENLVGSDATDILTGNTGANWIDGRSGNDTLLGGGGDDTLDGGAGDDRLVGGSGINQISGGTGLDTAVFDFTRSSATITKSGAVTKVVGASETSYLTDVERLQFSDQTVTVKGPAARSDFDGDLTSDVILQNGGTVVTWSMADGRYLSGRNITDGATGFAVVGTGDFNGDGSSDVLLQKGGTVVSWTMKNGGYHSGANITDGASGYDVRAIGDFDGDGTADIVLQNNGSVVVWTMKDGSYKSGSLITDGAGAFKVVAAGDFNGDGTDDILLQSGGTVVEWLMKDGGYSSGRNITDGAIGFDVRGAGDFNNDGTDDVVLQKDGTVVTWMMKDGAFAKGYNVTDGALGFKVRGTGDYNGDGTDDLLLQNGGTVVNWLMKDGNYNTGFNITDGATGFNIV